MPLRSDTTDSQPTVFLVDDDPSVRKGLARLLRSAGHQVETFESAMEFLANYRPESGVGCLVLDVRMPRLTGLDLQQRLGAGNATLPIIFITGHGDVPTSVGAMKAGAVDFLQKPVQDKDLLCAIEQALARSSSEHAARVEIASLRRSYETLTAREKEVMALVITGMLNKQIAEVIGTAEQTVKVHRGRIREKMGVLSVAELVRIAEKLGVKPA